MTKKPLTDKQKAHIEKMQEKARESKELKSKADKFDEIKKVYQDPIFSENKHRRQMVNLRNDWPELFNKLEETCGDSGIF